MHDNEEDVRDKSEATLEIEGGEIAADRRTVFDRLRDCDHGPEMISLIVTGTAMLASKLLEVGQAIGVEPLLGADPETKRRVVAVESVRIMEDILSELGVFEDSDPADPDTGEQTPLAPRAIR